MAGFRHQLSVRMSDSLHALLKAEAEAEGVSLSQYLRESAFARAWASRALRGEIPDVYWEALKRAREETQP
jgi:predicted HicB family RNase H-like nuclease